MIFAFNYYLIYPRVGIERRREGRGFASKKYSSKTIDNFNPCNLSIYKWFIHYSIRCYWKNNHLSLYRSHHSPATKQWNKQMEKAVSSFSPTLKSIQFPNDFLNLYLGKHTAIFLRKMQRLFIVIFFFLNIKCLYGENIERANIATNKYCNFNST